MIPGLSIAILGVIANSIFWFRYSKLGKESGNSILLVQSRLYRAKTLVDFCVTAALLSVALMPGSPLSYRLDKAAPPWWRCILYIQVSGRSGIE